MGPLARPGPSPFASCAGIRRRTPPPQAVRPCQLCADLVVVGGKERTDPRWSAHTDEGRRRSGRSRRQAAHCSDEFQENRVASEERGRSCHLACRESGPAPNRSAPPCRDLPVSQGDNLGFVSHQMTILTAPITACQACGGGERMLLRICNPNPRLSFRYPSCDDHERPSFPLPHLRALSRSGGQLVT